jgi:hypothetical protein
MREDRGPWYLLTGLVIGAALGVLYAWLLQPVQYTNTTPASLRADFKDQYRALIASAYMADGDLVRARARLDLLKDQDVYQVLAVQAQQSLAAGKAPQEARALGMLAVALGQSPPTLPAPGTLGATGAPAGGSASALPGEETASPMTPGTQAITQTLTSTATLITTPSGGMPTPASQATQPGPTLAPTITLLPTRTSSPTPGAPFALKSEELSCKDDLGTPLVIVQAYDAAGQGVPGVEAVVEWDGGESRFFTGLKPELGMGYADFAMTPGVVYTLRLAAGGQIIPNLAPTECEAQDGGRFWGSWVLVFTQP